MKLAKTILRTDKYHSPDRVLEVTPDRLKRWADTFQKMTANGNVIPSGWDHSSKAEELLPITMASWKNRKRSAKDTAGRLVEFKLSEDGNSADITVEYDDALAKDKASKNIVYVSPVISDSWKDGGGNEYQDCITHVDLVNHPVDRSQTPFVPVEGTIACAIRMGLSEPAFARLAEEDEPPAEDDSDEGGEDELPEKTPLDQNKLKEVVEALKSLDIVLADDTTSENFLNYLHTALLTAAAHRGEDPTGNDMNPSGTQVGDPGMAALSVEARGAIAWAEKLHRGNVATRLQTCLNEGRCTPAEHAEWVKQLPTIKLSLDNKNQPASSRLEFFLDDRDTVPKGTYWEPGSKLRLALETADPPSEFGEMTAEQIEEASNFALGRKTKQA